VLQRAAVCCSMCIESRLLLKGGYHSAFEIKIDALCERAAVCCSVLQCVVVCCSVLQCVAVCCSVLYCVAVCCRVCIESSLLLAWQQDIILHSK